MRFVLNSDILHTEELIHKRLPGHLERFAKECASHGAVVVFPRTVLLEVERKQAELLEAASAQLREAYKTLRRAGVQFTEVAPGDVYAMPDVPEMFRKCGVTVEVETPTLADYEDAERRACLHLPPQAPSATSDEMRDLVIWALALRVSQRDGRAMLVSRDEVHTHLRGDEEAAGAKLERARSVEDALELLGVEGVSGALARRLLGPLWDSLRAAKVPLSDAPSIRLVTNASFIQGEAGVGVARFQFLAKTDNGHDLKASAEIHRTGDVVTKVSVSNIRVDGQRWKARDIEVRPNVQVSMPGTPAQERLGALREAIGEDA